MPEIEELKTLLKELPKEYAELSQKVAQAERFYKEESEKVELIKAHEYLKFKALQSDIKKADADAKTTASDVVHAAVMELIKVESEYKSLKCQLEAFDKNIQLFRNRCELFICETYSTNALQYVGNIRGKEVKW